MSGESEVGIPRDQVLEVLRFHGVECFAANADAKAIALTRGEVTEVHPLPEIVGRRMLHYLHRKFDIPIHHLFNPGMVLGGNVRSIATARKKPTPPPASSDK